MGGVRTPPHRASGRWRRAGRMDCRTGQSGSWSMIAVRRSAFKCASPLHLRASPFGAGPYRRSPMTSPVAAEWSPHRAMWVGFPSHADLWESDLAEAQREVATLVHALAGPGREQVKLMTVGDEALATAHALLGDSAGVEIVPGRFGDIWLRDTGPIFTGPGRAAAFRFNGWGGRYDLP